MRVALAGASSHAHEHAFKPHPPLSNPQQCLPCPAAGGTLGDYFGRRLPNSPNGRILTNQFSVLIGLPASFVVLKGRAGWGLCGKGPAT